MNMIRLAHFFNKTILVCIPSLFEDQQPRCFKLVGIEELGLWLESEELAEMLGSPEGTRSPQGAVAAFFPFSHIAYVMPEVHPLAIIARPPIAAEPKKPQRQQRDKPPKAEHRQSHPARPLTAAEPKEPQRHRKGKPSKTEQRRRHPGIHRKGKK